MAKRVLKFLGFKVAKVGAILGIPFGIGKIAFLWPAFIKWTGMEEIGFWSVWSVGFLILLLLIAAIMATVLLVLFVRKNWEWAG